MMEVMIKTKSDAAHYWVREFNAIDQQIIAELWRLNPDRWCEITLPRIGDRVTFSCMISDPSLDSGEVIQVKDGIYTIRIDDGREVATAPDSFYVDRYDTLPMWGTMWSFGDSLDDDWIAQYGGLRALSDCGFRVYESDEYGYYFGIDGAGYDFYESHWIPLYERRGLKWHDEGEEEAA